MATAFVAAPPPGDIPEGLALHPALESMDLSDNNLTAMPQDWYSTNIASIQQAPLVNLRLGHNEFQVRIIPPVRQRAVLSHAAADPTTISIATWHTPSAHQSNL